MIRLKNVKKKYGDRTVLNIEELEFNDGLIYAVLGPNGSGKSTLLKILSGVDRSFEGLVTINGSSKAYEDVSYLPQKPYLFDLSVMENVVLGIKKTKDARLRALGILKQLGVDNFEKSRLCELSGGEAQRVAVARTLICGKKIVLLDEPASSVDIKSIKLLEECIKNSARNGGTTLIFTTHSPSQALRLASKVIILISGEIADIGNPEVVLKNESNEKTSDFLLNWRL